MVGLSDRDGVGPAGRGHGEPEGEVVGLGAGLTRNTVSSGGGKVAASCSEKATTDS